MNSGAFFDTRQLGPSTRVVETGRPCTRAYTKMVYPRTVTHPSTNRARRRATTLIETNTLPLSQTATVWLH